MADGKKKQNSIVGGAIFLGIGLVAMLVVGLTKGTNDDLFFLSAMTAAIGAGTLFWGLVLPADK